MIPSNDCFTAINTFPIVAKREVNKEWRTGTEDTNPKLKWQLRSISQEKQTNIKGNYVLLSHFSNRLDEYPWERPRLLMETTSDLGATTVEIAFGLDPACLGNGISVRWNMFCKKRHCRCGLFFELLVSKPKLRLNVLWQFWYSVLFAVYPIIDHLIITSSSAETCGLCQLGGRQEAWLVWSDLLSLLTWAYKH